MAPCASNVAIMTSTLTGFSYSSCSNIIIISEVTVGLARSAGQRSRHPWYRRTKAVKKRVPPYNDL